jgi:hypothetical protein
MQTPIGHRVVVIGRPPTGTKTRQRQPLPRRATGRRIVIIRDGQFVAGRPGG